MSKTPAMESAVAIIPIRDMDRSIDFYETVLGFTATMVSPDKSFAIIKNGPSVLQLLRTDSEEALTATANHISVYIWVTAVDGLYASLQARLEALPEGRLRPPFNQPYGMREFHVKDPDGCLLFFGEDLDEI